MLFTIYLAPGSGVPPTQSQHICIFSSLYAEFVMSVTVADSSRPAHAYLTLQPMCHSERAQSWLCQDRTSRNTKISTTIHVTQSCVKRKTPLSEKSMSNTQPLLLQFINTFHLLIYVSKIRSEYSHCFHHNTYPKTPGNNCSEKLDKLLAHRILLHLLIKDKVRGLNC